MGKATKEDMIRRERRIQELMAAGIDRKQIFATVAKEEKISEGSVRKQYYLIIDELQQLAKEQREELRATLMARQEAIYQKAMDKQSLKVALEVTNAQAKLGGLFEAEVGQSRQPEAIIFKEKDFSQPLQVVPKKAENE